MPAAIKKEKVVELVLAFIKKVGRNPKTKEFNKGEVGCSIDPVYRIWGNMGKMFEDIGCIPNQVFWGRKLIIKQVKLLIEDLGHFPTTKDINKASNNNANYPSQPTILKYVGNLEELALACCEKPNQINWDKGKVILQIKNLIKEIGHFPSIEEINKASKAEVYYPNCCSIYRHLGNMEELALACGEKYIPKNGYSIPVDDPVYGYFVSTIEHRVFHALLKYVEPENIERQKKYDELFHTKTQHTADFYIPKYDIIIEATTKDNNLHDYSKRKQWKESLSDRVIFVYSTQDVDNLMEGLIE